MKRLSELLHRSLAPIAVGALLATGIILPSSGLNAMAAFAENSPTSTTSTTSTTGPAEPADSNTSETVPDTTFDPGLIISDYNFFNAKSMSEADVQDFLESQECDSADGSPCLSDYSQDTLDQPAEEELPGHCAAYEGDAHEPASRIISKVATACGISPRVLLVTLQKEQSLVTRPSTSGYLHAMGYGCPDTAPCDAEYFGFFNQVYKAAWQFRQYAQQPDRRYEIGAITVQFNPNQACGSSMVDIKNQATANLYNYTPYQPDEAAVASLGGGDDCSSHGNLNFWMLYNEWFGSSTFVRYPAFFDSCMNLVGGQPCREAQPLPSI